METILITENNLETNGWTFGQWYYDKLEMKVWSKEIHIKDKTFYCELMHESNTKGRDWNVHVDNQDRESVGHMDVSTYTQIDKFIELLNE